jgi:hypothetical protein
LDTLEAIFEREKKQNTIKLSTTYGCIMETIDNDPKDETKSKVTYTVFNPNDSTNTHHGWSNYMMIQKINISV